MSGSYTPAWAGDGEIDGSPVSEEGRYGSGVGFHDGKGDRSNDETENTNVNDSPQVRTGPATFGEPRHPSILVETPGPQGVAIIETVTIHRCEGGGYTVFAECEELPAGLDESDSVEATVWGTREGDVTDLRFAVKALRVAPDGGFQVVFRCDEEAPVLYRWHAAGCIVCHRERGGHR